MLKHIPLSAADPFADLFDILQGVELPDDSCTELVWNMPLKKIGHRLFHRGKIQLRHACSLTVLFFRILDVHSYIIHKTCIAKITKLLRKCAVRIQLYGITKRADLFNKGADIPLQERFSAGDGHAVQNALPLFKKSQDLFLRIHLQILCFSHKKRIMAERAAQIASAGK